MVWSAKTINRQNKEYIVIRHKLRDVDDIISGVKFRRGYGVVDKNSKLYTQIKKLPFIKDALEFPLLHLKNLPFVINDRQIETIYGKDVYLHYKKLKEEFNKKEAVRKAIEKEEKHLEESDLCKYRTSTTGELCKNKATNSPSAYCRLHLLLDPKLEEIGIKLPKVMSKDEKKAYRKKVVEKLKKT